MLDPQDLDLPAIIRCYVDWQGHGSFNEIGDWVYATIPTGFGYDNGLPDGPIVNYGNWFTIRFYIIFSRNDSG